MNSQAPARTTPRPARHACALPSRRTCIRRYRCLECGWTFSRVFGTGTDADGRWYRDVYDDDAELTSLAAVTQEHPGGPITVQLI